MASDTARALSILGTCFGPASVARARERRLELALNHRLDELAHPVAQAGFDRIKPIVEKIDRRLGCRVQDRRYRAIVGHGVVPRCASTPALFVFQPAEGTPPSIPSSPRTQPSPDLHAFLFFPAPPPPK